MSAGAEMDGRMELDTFEMVAYFSAIVNGAYLRDETVDFFMAL